jgi:hypothetical protein
MPFGWGPSFRNEGNTYMLSTSGFAKPKMARRLDVGSDKLDMMASSVYGDRPGTTGSDISRIGSLV